jgi:8-oxo-dGTP diphosphatase
VFDVAVTYILRERNGTVEVLLGEKLTGIGQGKLVAPGGKREGGEEPADTAVREIREEVGLLVAKDALSHIATIRYPFLGREAMSQRSFAFLTREFVGEPVPSRELVATWWPLADIPFHRMWADAALWLPQAIQGEFITATIEIGQDNEVLGSTLTR